MIYALTLRNTCYYLEESGIKILKLKDRLTIISLQLCFQPGHKKQRKESESESDSELDDLFKD
jgi:hypothetical protein